MPEKHAHWVYIKPLAYPNEYLCECSKCQYQKLFETGENRYRVAPICPNPKCSAIMDETEKEKER